MSENLTERNQKECYERWWDCCDCSCRYYLNCQNGKFNEIIEDDCKMDKNQILKDLEAQMCIFKIEITWMNRIKTHIKMPGDTYSKFLHLAQEKFPEITNIKIIETELII